MIIQIGLLQDVVQRSVAREERVDRGVALLVTDRTRRRVVLSVMTAAGGRRSGRCDATFPRRPLGGARPSSVSSGCSAWTSSSPSDGAARQTLLYGGTARPSLFPRRRSSVKPSPPRTVRANSIPPCADQGTRQADDPVKIMDKIRIWRPQSIEGAFTPRELCDIVDSAKYKSTFKTKLIKFVRFRKTTTSTNLEIIFNKKESG